MSELDIYPISYANAVAIDYTPKPEAGEYGAIIYFSDGEVFVEEIGERGVTHA